LVEILVARSLNRHAKPLILVNQDGFYDDLLRFFARMTEENFKSPNLHEQIVVTPTVAGVWALLENPPAAAVDALWR